ncbi:MAG: rRNA methyltransferase [Verrucomicrobiaceae bacterium]|nr:rRNA methyltransferase [Verrucomicrobiaceae bacterium]
MNEKPTLSSASGGLPSSVRWAQLILRDRLGAGDVVVDATMGNGHDTLFLSECVAPDGRVFAFDVQAAALTETAKRVPMERCTLIHAGHETMREKLPAELHGQIAAIMFNLGYLPGSDKTCITRTETTLAALSQAAELLRPGGIITLAVYPGHEGGAEESREISKWAAQLDPRRFEVQHLRPVNRSAAPPELWLIWRGLRTQ